MKNLEFILKNITNTYNLTPFQINQLRKQLKYFKNGNIIIPKKWQTVLNVDILTAYKILDYISRLGYLKPVFEIYCSRCHKSNNLIVDNLVEFNEKIDNCNECNHELNFLEDAIRLYKVINYG